MKKLLFPVLLAVATLAASCHTEKFDTAPRAAADTAPVTVDEAIEDMYSFLDAAYGKGTRAASRTIAGIASFKSVAASTRTGGGNASDSGEATATAPPAERNIAYVVNFAEGGFAVLGARETIPEVLCITEEGLFGEGEIEELTRELTQEPSSVVISDMIVSVDPIRFVKKELLAYALAADVEGVRAAAETKWSRQNARALASDATWSAWGDFAKSGPLLTTLWNQTYPYNKDCPPDPNDNSRTSYTGCVATALVQIIAHNEKPYPSAIDGNAASNWTDIKANYYNPSKTAIRTNAQMVVENDLAAITHYIGQGVDMNYSYFHGSAASSSKAESYLRERNIGYRNVRRHIWYNTTHFTDMLDSGKPVYLSAAGDGGAHAWVVDGSVYQKRTRPGDNGETQTERRFMLHCNFGWGGTANGYYFSEAFSPNQGPVATEAGKDATNPGSNGRNYNRQYQIIQYDL
jgi:hypothetical protein